MNSNLIKVIANNNKDIRSSAGHGRGLTPDLLTAKLNALNPNDNAGND
jgi:hypothetical protein